MIRRFQKINKTKWAGIAILAIFILCAVLAPHIAPHDPWDFGIPFQTPNRINFLGTNDIGQDIFSEFIYGARVSLTVGFLAGLIAVALGTVMGLVAGFRRGFLDHALMGLTDVVLVIPALPLVILVSVYMGASMWNMILVIGLVWWPSTTRVIRSRVLSIREAGYVESSRAMGAGDFWLMRRHLLPNIVPLILAKFVLSIAVAMLMEASLSFLGLGDPSAKSWGIMLHYAFNRGAILRELWWWYLPPGLAIGVCILALTLISYSIEERSDPRLRKVLER